MGLKKGQTNNRAGRPPKGRALAERLTTALNRNADFGIVKGKRIVILADAVVNALVTGEVELPTGIRVKLEPREWIDLFKFVANHVDGPVKPQLELIGDNEHPIETVITVHYADAAPPAPGADDD